jgi:excisionase family DNA binding protein
MPSTFENAPVSGARKLEVAELRRCLGEQRSKGRRKLHEIELPDKLYRLLLRIVDDLADGKAVSLTAAAQEMTTQRAANFLGVSRQFLVRLLDEGKIPFHRAGTHRRVYFQDLILFRNERDRRRHEAIEQMARDAVKDGVYDEF